MNRTRVLVGLLIVLLLATIGLGAWVYAHRGYPNVVYYSRHTVTTSGQVLVLTVEMWDDPRRHWLRTLTTGATGESDPWLYRDGYQYDLNLRGGAQEPVSMSVGTLGIDAALLAGGLNALDAYWYATATGHRSLVSFAGHPALRFDSGNDAGDRTSTWLDARTHALLGETSSNGASVDTLRYTRWARIPPNALPATFFDPPRTHQNLWDRATGWVQDRMAGR